MDCETVLRRVKNANYVHLMAQLCLRYIRHGYWKEMNLLLVKIEVIQAEFCAVQQVLAFILDIQQSQRHIPLEVH